MTNRTMALKAPTWLILAAALACAAPSAALAQDRDQAAARLAGRTLHWTADNVTDAHVSGPVNLVVDTTVDAADRDQISLTVASSVTRVGGGLARRMVTRVKVAFAQVTAERQGDPAWTVRLECKDGSNCIAWSLVSYVNDDPNAVRPAGGLELGTNLAADPAAIGRLYADLCALAAACKG